MGGDGEGEEVTFEEGEDVEEEDADIDNVSVLLMKNYVQILISMNSPGKLKTLETEVGC